MDSGSAHDERVEQVAQSLLQSLRSFLSTTPSWFRLAATALLGVVAVAVVCIGVFFFVLSRGPIDLTWLAPEIIASLGEHAGKGYKFNLTHVAVTTSDNGPTLSVDGLAVKNGDRTILAAPRAELSLDMGWLLLGKVKPSRLEVMDLDLRLSVLPDGGVALSAGAAPMPAATIAPEAAQATTPRVALMRSIVGALKGLMDLATSPTSAIGALDRLGVSHGRLLVDDRTTNRTLRYDDLTLSLDKSDGNMSFSLSAAGPSGHWTADALASGAPGGKRDFRAAIRDLSIDEVSLIGGFRPSSFDTDALMGVDLAFTLAPNDEVTQASGRLEVGKGYFRLEDRDHEPFMIERVALDASWSAKAHKVVIAPLEFKAGGFDFTASIEATPPAELLGGGDPGADVWKLSLHLDKPTKIAPERATEKVVDISQFDVNARFLHGQNRLTIDSFALAGPEIHADLTASLELNAAPHLQYEIVVQNSHIRALARLWPTHVTPTVRTWFADHATDGVITKAKCAGDFDDAALTAMRYERPPPDGALLLEGDVTDATVVDVLEGMPPVTGIAGHLRVTGRTSGFTANAAMIETAPGRRLVLSQGSFLVTDNKLRPTPATLEVKAAGSIEAVSDLLRLPSIASHASIPVEPGTLKGHLDGRMRLDFEIGENTRDDQMKFWVDAMTSNLSVDHLIGKERLEAAALHVMASPAGLEVSGPGRLFGAPATLELHRAFGVKGPAQAQLTFAFDDAARQRAGYAITGMTGPVSAIVRTPLPIEDVKTEVELDLTRVAFDNPVPGLIKPAGKPAKATFLLVHRPDAVAIEQLNFNAGTAQAQGNIDFTKEGAFRSAKISPIRLSPGDDMRLDIQKTGALTKIAIHGANVDARPILQSYFRVGGRSASAGAAKPAAESNSNNFGDHDVDFSSPVVTGFGKQILSNVSLKLESRSGRPKGLTLTGNFGHERVGATITRAQNDIPQLDIATNDAGSLLSFVDLYRKMESGAMTVSLQIAANRSEGTVRIRDFYVKGEPTMRQLMQQSGNLRTDDHGVTRFDPDSVQIGQLLAEFGWNDGRLSVRQGVMSGPAIGLTFDGFVDMPHDSIDLAGSYVPAYALNSLLSNIPVVGVLVAGGQNEGVFALNYRLSGAISAPVVTVNPLSAIAPGLMRKIMGVLDGTAHVPH